MQCLWSRKYFLNFPPQQKALSFSQTPKKVVNESHQFIPVQMLPINLLELWDLKKENLTTLVRFNSQIYQKTISKKFNQENRPLVFK